MYSDKLVLFGQNWLFGGKIGFIIANWFYLGKLIVVGKLVVFAQNLLYSGKSGCIRSNWLYLGKICCIGTNCIYLGKIRSTREIGFIFG